MKYKINKGFIVQKIGNNLTVFDGEKSDLISFNGVGTVIFEKIKKGWDADRIVEEIMNKYSVDEKRAKKDTEEFIMQLKKNKIII